MVRHFGMFQFHPEITAIQVAECFSEMSAMVGKIPGLLALEHGPYDSPEGLSDGFTHGFVMTFDTSSNRDAYLPHPEHERVRQIVVPKLSRVIVFDFEI